MAQGQCKLTGKTGTFVRAHIVPQALTPPEIKGDALIQPGRDGRFIKRMTSWYDPRLVTAEGEAILSDYDRFAVEEFRRHRLIWSSWGGSSKLDAPDHFVLPIPEVGWGAREIEFRDPLKLRLFFLSLLWRAAETTLWEFEQIFIEDPDLSQLRQMVLQANPYPLHFFPLQLLQLSTRGKPHNWTPYPFMASDCTPDGEAAPEPYPVYRFYFDGLIATFRSDNLTEEYVRERDGVFLGAAKLAVPTIEFEKSWEMENLRRAMIERLRSSFPGDELQT